MAQSRKVLPHHFFEAQLCIDVAGLHQMGFCSSRDRGDALALTWFRLLEASVRGCSSVRAPLQRRVSVSCEHKLFGIGAWDG